MRAYLTYFKTRYLCILQYRAAALAGVVTQVGFGLILILPFYALHASGGEGFPMDMESVASYIWLQQAFLMLVSYSWEGDIIDSIKTGAIAVELCRPLDVYAMWFTRHLAQRVAKVSLRAGPVLIVAFLIPKPLGLSLPESPLAFGLFLVSLVLGTLVMTSMVMLVYNTTFHTLTSVGIPIFLYAVMDFFGGQIIPLNFYPPFLYRLCSLLPFGSVSNVPFRIYVGDISGPQALFSMGLQLFWVLTLVGTGYIWNRLALRRVVSQGG